MAQRVAVHRIIHGHGEGQRVFEPGETLNTDDHGISDEELARLDERGAVRLPRDDSTVAVPPQPAVVMERAEDAEGDAARRTENGGNGRRQGRTDNIDEL